MEAGSKRKRDLDCPRILYYTPQKTFERLFKEESLDDLKEVVRKKLGLDSDTVISLSQVRGDASVALEDEDDFDAFYNAVHASSIAKISATVQSKTPKATKKTATADKADTEMTETSKEKKKTNEPPAPAMAIHPPGDAAQQPPIAPTEVARVRKRVVSSAKPSKTAEIQSDEPPPKRVKIAAATTTPVTQSTAVPSALEPVAQTQMPADTSQAEASKIPSLPHDKPSAKALSQPPMTSAPDKATDALKSQDKVKDVSDKPAAKVGRITKLYVVKSASPSAAAVSEEVQKPKKKKKKPQVQEEKEGGKDKSAEKPKETSDHQASAVTPALTADLRPSAQETVMTPQAPLPIEKNVLEIPEKKDAKRKTRKSRTTPDNAVPETTALAESKPKEKGQSKSKVREATSSAVDPPASTTSEGFTPDSESSIAAISRSLIEKYLDKRPENEKALVQAEPVEDVEVSHQASSVASALNAAGKSNTGLKPLCPYCGKNLSHARANCRIIRAVPDVIIKRIAEMKQDPSEGVEKWIKELEELVDRKRAIAFRKKALNVDSGSVARTRHADFSNTSTSTIPVVPLPDTRHSSSADSSDSGSDTPLTLKTAKPSAQSIAKRSQPSLPVLQPAIEPPKSSPPQSDDEQSSTSSEDESPPIEKIPTLESLLNDEALEAVVFGSRTKLTAADVPSSSESSEEDESGDVVLDNESEESESWGRRRQSFVSMPMLGSSDDEMENAARDEYGEEEEEHEGEEEEEENIPLRQIFAPPLVIPAESIRGERPSNEDGDLIQGDPSFQQIGEIVSPTEGNRAGDEAFEEALAKENAVFDFAQSHSPSLQVKQQDPSVGAQTLLETSDLPANSIDYDVDVSNGASLVEAPDEPSLMPGNAPTSLTMAIDVEPDPLEDVTMDAPPDEQDSDQEDIPSTPREELGRASTPKPGIVLRMKSRLGLASPQSQKSMVAPTRPVQTRSASSKNREKIQDLEESNVNGDIVAPSQETKMNGTVSKPMATHSVAAKGVPVPREEDSEGRKDPSPPPRRMTRSSSKHLSSNPVLVQASKRVSKNAQMPKTIAEKPEDKSQERLTRDKKLLKETKRQKKGAEAAKSMKPSQAEVTGETRRAPARNANDQMLPPSSPPFINTWVTLPSPPPAQPLQSDAAMIDELQSDVDPGPISGQNKTKNESNSMRPHISHEQDGGQANASNIEQSSPNKPLFLPSESQTVFPYTQAQTQKQEFQSEKSESEMSSESESQSTESEEEKEVRASIVKKNGTSSLSSSSASHFQPRYRKLTDIASQAPTLFTPKVIRTASLAAGARLTRSVPLKGRNRLQELYGTFGIEAGNSSEEAEETESPSESEEEEKSHIPKARRAGALKRRMSFA